MDGTTIDSEWAWQASAKLALKSLGIESTMDEWALFRATPASHFAGKSLFRNFAASILENYGLTDKIKLDEFSKLTDKYRHELLTTVELKPGASELFNKLGERGVKKGIITSAGGLEINFLKENPEIREFLKSCDFILHGDILPEGTRAKPAADPYLIGAEIVNEQFRSEGKGKHLIPGKSANAFVTEDTGGGIQAGNSAGFDTVGVVKKLSQAKDPDKKPKYISTPVEIEREL